MGKNPYLKNETEEKDVQTEEEPKKKQKPKALYVAMAAVFAVVCFLGGAFATWFSLDSELRSLVKLKNRIQNDYFEEVSDEKFYGAVFDGINLGVLDEYSWYMTADEYKDMRSSGKGNQSGIGVTLDVVDENGGKQMLVVLVSGNSPAQQAGIKEGDYILGYGDNENEIVDGTDFDVFLEYIQNKQEQETFYIKIKRGKVGETHVIPIYKADFVSSYVCYRTNGTSYSFTGKKANDWTKGNDALSALDGETAYIRLTQFNGNAAKEFDKAMEQFKADGKKNLLLDLRGNGGGYLDVMQEIAKYFCKRATNNRPVVAVADYGEYKEEFKAKGNEFYEYFTNESKICVLADSASASATECLIGCMLDYETISYADICLSLRDGVAKTYGKGIMQTTYPLRWLHGDAVKLTTAKICWPISGNCIHGRGVLATDGTKVVAESQENDVEIINAVQALFGISTI